MCKGLFPILGVVLIAGFILLGLQVHETDQDIKRYSLNASTIAEAVATQLEPSDSSTGSPNSFLCDTASGGLDSPSARAFDKSHNLPYACPTDQ